MEFPLEPCSNSWTCRRGPSIEAISKGLFNAYDNNPHDQWVDFQEYMIIEMVFASENISEALVSTFNVIDKAGLFCR